MSKNGSTWNGRGSSNSGKWTLNNMNRTLIGILCQNLWLHACITFQSISLSLTFKCGINHSPPPKKAGPIWMNALDYEKQPLNFTKVVIWNLTPKSKKELLPGWIKSFWLCGFIISTKTSQPLMILLKNRWPATGSAVNIFGSYWKAGTVLRRLFFSMWYSPHFWY